MRQLKQDPAQGHAAVAMITSLQEPEHRQKAERAGVDAYIVPPTVMTPHYATLLEAKLRDLVERRRTRGRPA